MGVAAYNRGSQAIKEDIARSMRPAEFQMMDDLNSLGKYEDAGTPFAEIQFVSSHGGWFAECPKTGYGFYYPTLREAVRRWNVVVDGYKNGVWFATPMKREV